MKRIFNRSFYRGVLACVVYSSCFCAVNAEEREADSVLPPIDVDYCARMDILEQTSAARDTADRLLKYAKFLDDVKKQKEAIKKMRVGNVQVMLSAYKGWIESAWVIDVMKQDVLVEISKALELLDKKEPGGVTYHEIQAFNSKIDKHISNLENHYQKKISLILSKSGDDSDSFRADPESGLISEGGQSAILSYAFELTKSQTKRELDEWKMDLVLGAACKSSHAKMYLSSTCELYKDEELLSHSVNEARASFIKDLSRLPLCMNTYYAFREMRDAQPNANSETLLGLVIDKYRDLFEVVYAIEDMVKRHDQNSLIQLLVVAEKVHDFEEAMKKNIEILSENYRNLEKDISQGVVKLEAFYTTLEQEEFSSYVNEQYRTFIENRLMTIKNMYFALEEGDYVRVVQLAARLTGDSQNNYTGFSQYAVPLAAAMSANTSAEVEAALDPLVAPTRQYKIKVKEPMVSIVGTMGLSFAYVDKEIEASATEEESTETGNAAAPMLSAALQISAPKGIGCNRCYHAYNIGFLDFGAAAFEYDNFDEVEEVDADYSDKVVRISLGYSQSFGKNPIVWGIDFGYRPYDESTSARVYVGIESGLLNF